MIDYQRTFHCDGVEKKEKDFGKSRIKSFFIEEEKTWLFVCHGAGERGNYSNGAKIAQPEKLASYINWCESRGYGIVIICCHPKIVGECHPKFKPYVMFPEYNGVVWTRFESPDDISVGREF